MISASEAAKMTTSVLSDEVTTILSVIEKGVVRAAHMGHYGMYYVAPEDTDIDILDEVSKKLLEFGYRMTDWEQSHLGWSTRITWK